MADEHDPLCLQNPVWLPAFHDAPCHCLWIRVGRADELAKANELKMIEQQMKDEGESDVSYGTITTEQQKLWPKTSATREPWDRCRVWGCTSPAAHYIRDYPGDKGTLFYCPTHYAAVLRTRLETYQVTLAEHQSKVRTSEAKIEMLNQAMAALNGGAPK